MFAASKSGQSAAAVDPFFRYVPLLLDTTSTNGQQNNTFLDSSTNNFTITRNGTPTQGSVTPYWPNGQWSNYFNGSTDYLTPPSNAAFAFGTGDFTLECWIYTIAASDVGIYEGRASGSGTAGFTLGAFSSSVIRVYTGTSAIISSSGTSYLNQWTHVAVVRASGTTTLYINGTSVGTSASMGNLTDTTPVIGAGRYTGTTTPSAFFNGYISNFRMVKGTAVYTGNFTPSANPLTAITNTSLLTCQSNRFKDNSTNNFTITASGSPRVQAFQPFSPAASYTPAAYGGSGYFNGASANSYLSSSGNASTAMGTGDFTWECWVYPLGSTGYQDFIDTRSNVALGSTDGFFWGLNNNTLTPIVYTTSVLLTSSANIVLNTWNHVAVTRSGTTLTIWVNGVSGGTATNSTNLSNQSFSVGSANTTNVQTNGYISNLRIVKGTAVYTAAFTPPTAPVTAITNTSLLLNCTNAGIYDAAVQNNAITVGSAQASITQYKWSPTSMRFNGTSDYLDLGTNQAFVLGAGNFTVEGWVYPTSTAAGHWMFLQGNATANAAVRIGCQSNQVFLLMSTNGTTNTISSGLVGSVPINAWTYLAVTRSGTTVTLYVNGTSVYTSTALSTSALMTGIYNLVGRIDPTNLQYFTGYVQDVRLTKGVARTITTPTTAFPTR